MFLARIGSFRTERLNAERIACTHLADFLRLYQDPRVTATLTPHGRPLQETEIERNLQSKLEHWGRYGFGDWCFQDRADGQFVGRAGLRQVETDHRQEVELAYALMPEFWGNGLATEMVRAILKLAFDRIRLEQVVCHTLTTNRASQRVMEKAGFRFEKCILHVGKPHLLYRLIHSDFKRNVEHPPAVLRSRSRDLGAWIASADARLDFHGTV